MSVAWHAILDGETKLRAMETALGIGAALREWRSPPERAADVLRGDAALPILFAYLDCLQPDQGHRERALDSLDRVADGAALLSDVPGMFGFVGAAWTLEHVSRLLEVYDPSVNAAVDEALLDILHVDPEWLQFEWMAGVTGFAVYALERRPAGASVAILERVVQWLAQHGERSADGVRWRVPDWMPLARDRARFPNGCYALDPAHGAAGPIAILAACCRLGIAEPAASSLLADSVRWLLAQRRAGEFPDLLGESPQGLGWCRGRPGVPAVLAAAGVDGWLDAACASTRPEQPKPADAMLCHGTAGLGHLFNRMYQASGHPALADAARRSFLRTLELAQPGAGIGGYQHFDDTGWVDWPGLLFGASGVALALLAAASDVEPAWDRLLLVSQAISR